MALIKFVYGTEAQILALVPTDAAWVDRAFYYPEDKPYFYQALDGVMKKYGGGETSGVGIRLNGSIIGGVKSLIESTDILTIPENYEYNVHRLNVQGNINSEGEINIM